MDARTPAMNNLPFNVQEINKSIRELSASAQKLSPSGQKDNETDEEKIRNFFDSLKRKKYQQLTVTINEVTVTDISSCSCDDF